MTNSNLQVKSPSNKDPLSLWSPFDLDTISFVNQHPHVRSKLSSIIIRKPLSKDNIIDHISRNWMNSNLDITPPLHNYIYTPPSWRECIFSIFFYIISTYSRKHIIPGRSIEPLRDCNCCSFSNKSHVERSSFPWRYKPESISDKPHKVYVHIFLNIFLLLSDSFNATDEVALNVQQWDL